MQEYIYNMPTVMAAADLFISRAGASTLNEIAAAGTPSMIVPSPNVTNNHQEKNARVLEAGGGAVVLLEKDCTPEKLYSLIRELLADDARRAEMSRKLHAQMKLDATDRIIEKDHLTTLMITHNMRDAIQHGNRLIMMYEGRIVIDVSGEEKKKLTVPQLLELFSKVSGSDEADDKLLLS